MAIITDLSFLLENKGTLDAKQNFKTIAEMKAFDERFLANTSLATCDETGSLYIYNAKNSDDPKTGKWRAVEGSVVDVVEKDNTSAVSSKGVYGALYVTVPEVPQHYEQTSVGELGALEIVADGTVTDSSTQIAISDVTPLKDGETWTPSIGEYAVLIALVPESEEEKYAKNSDVYDKATVDEKITEIASGGLKPMSEAEFNTFWDSLEITSANYVAPTP